MAIKQDDFKNILNYTEYLKEQAISNEDIEKHDTFIRNIGDIKNNISIINEDIIKLQTILTNNDYRIKSVNETDNKTFYKIIYPKESYNIFTNFQDLLMTAEETDYELYHNYLKIIYPDDNQINLDTEIEIEINNFNRIHIPIGLPKICKGIGIGKKIYKLFIGKINFISTNKFDRSLDSIFVWDSLRKDTDIYSFILNEQMICFSTNLDFETIKNILLDFYKYELEDLKMEIINNQHIIDSDFREKYFKDILNTDLKFLI